MRIPFHLVDVFTDRPLSGNQLCVVPDAGDLSAETMQALALEIGFSETTFVTDARNDRYTMRIFTPSSELPFAGHPSLGTAFVLVEEGRVSHQVKQVVKAGEFDIEVDRSRGYVRMRQLSPSFGRRCEVGEVSAVIGLSDDDLEADPGPQVVGTGLPHLVVRVRDTAAVSRATPDVARLAQLLRDVGVDGVYFFAVDGDSVKARLFAPGIGVPEDAATGSAAGPLGAYVVEYGILPPGQVVISQGEELRRPSTLVVEVRRAESGAESGWDVFVAGGVVKVGSGVFDLALQPVGKDHGVRPAECAGMKASRGDIRRLRGTGPSWRTCWDTL